MNARLLILVFPALCLISCQSPKIPSPPPEMEGVLREISSRLEVIKEYSAIFEVVSHGDLVSSRSLSCMAFPQGKWLVESHFKRPDLFYTRREYPPYGRSGDSQYLDRRICSLSDGETIWIFTQKEEDILQGEGEKRGHANLKDSEISKYNLKTLTRKGFPLFPLSDIFLLSPFECCDISTLKIEKEEDDTWIFRAKSREYYNLADQVLMTIRKKDGLLIKMEHEITGAGILDQRILKEVRVNPQFPEDFFRFRPTPNSKIKDRTREYLSFHKKIALKTLRIYQIIFFLD